MACQETEEPQQPDVTDTLDIEPTDTIRIPTDSVVAPIDTIFGPPTDLVVLEEAIHFYVFGDFGRNGANNQLQLARMMDTVSTILEPQFIVSTGDNFYSDGVSSVTDPLWQTSFEDIYSTKNGLKNPWYVVLGNHDYHLDPEAEIAYTEVSDRWSMPGHYYFKDFEQGEMSMRMVFLDTNPFIDKYYEQGKFKNKVILQDTTYYLNWMDSLFSDDTKTWKIAVGHHPIYSGEGRGSELTSMRNHVNGRLIEKGVNLYFCGHEHVIRHVKKEGPLHYITSGAGAKTVQANDIPETLFASGSTAFAIISATTDSIYIQTVNHRGKIEYSTTIK